MKIARTRPAATISQEERGNMPPLPGAKGRGKGTTPQTLIFSAVRLPGVAASPSRRSSRGCSPSTPRTAPARPATAWAPSMFFDADLVVPDPELCPARRARSRRGPAREPVLHQTLRGLAKALQVRHPHPVARAAGTGARRDPERLRRGSRSRSILQGRRAAPYAYQKPFEGVLHNLERRWRETDSAWVREELRRYQTDKPCAACNGARLKPEALAVQVRRHATSATSPTCRSATR